MIHKKFIKASIEQSAINKPLLFKVLRTSELILLLRLTKNIKRISIIPNQVPRLTIIFGKLMDFVLISFIKPDRRKTFKFNLSGYKVTS